MFKSPFLIFLLFFKFFAFGEEDKDVEKIKVTGSHIKRIDVEGVSPISVIDQEQLDFSGFSSMGDVLRDTASASFGVSKHYSLTGGGGGSTSLRGVPRGYTISLLNGRRSIIGSLNLIPKSAIERVEILLDGASATYGSHAIGGVINFITKKDVSGFEFEAGMAVPEPEGGSEYYTSGTSGWSQANHSGLLSWSLRTNRPTYSKYRDYSKLEDYERFWSRYGSPGSYKIGDKWFPMPGCGEKNITDQGEKKGAICKFNPSQYAQLIPESYTLSLFSDIDFDISDNMETDLQFLFYYEKIIAELAPAPASLLKEDFTPKMQSVLKTALKVSSDIDAFIYRMVHEKGGKTPDNKRIIDADLLGGDIYMGFESYLADSWNVQGGLSLAGVVNHRKGKGYFSKKDRGNKKGLFTLMEEGKWIPTAQKEKGDVSSAYYTPEIIERGFGILSEVIADGELFSFPNGSLNMAVGARASLNSMKLDTDEITWDKKENKSHQWGGGVSLLGKGSQYYGSAFTEFSLPVNNLPVINNVEFILAGSTDYYEYSGFTSNPSLKGLPVNPKLGLKWHPLDFVSFRGTWATGYKAPSLLNLFLDTIISYPSGVDYEVCKTKPESSLCKDGTQFKTYFKGNKKLKPETSNSYNVGMILQPLNDLSFSVDFFQNEINGRMRPLKVSEITKLEADEGLEAVRKLGLNVERSDSGEIEKIINGYINSGSYLSQGLNIKLGIESPIFDDNKMYFNLDHVLFTSIQEKSFEEGEYVKRKGHFGYPPFRGQYALGVKLKNNSVFELSTRVTGAYHQEQAIPGTTTCQNNKDCGGLVSVNFKQKPVKIAGQKFDFSAHYEFSATLALPIQIFDSSSDIDGRVILKVENILGSDPPLHMEKGKVSQSNVAGLGDTALGTILDLFYTEGRVWRVNYAQNF